MYFKNFKFKGALFLQKLTQPHFDALLPKV